MMPTVSLYEHVGLGLIIEYPSGIVYSNQTGGTTCLQPTLEGAFVPLRNDCLLESLKLESPENALFEYFGGAKWHGTGATRGIDSEDADFIDQVLARHRLSEYLTVDRSRLRDSHEAWVWVTISAEEGALMAPVFSGFAPYPRGGVLTWSNTD